ncbi:2-hydroxyacid dehydrogenase [Planctobacterium marinum]|uniref:2-hydroxyacid dehydrogenase n=1 Tax=Planctobacterium marinum TaxID=1631968 RepID=UPI001E425C13|nr:2-hydroxyacid dehydrogenase [Planctobacterium marinum]MCC2604393.1 2-hydroxyacid dehydrogenase [Planctobacterium marinum]
MKVAVFSAKSYDQWFLQKHAIDTAIEFTFFETALSPETVALADGFDAVNCFVNDNLSKAVLKTLKSFGILHISLRCAGFNNVALQQAAKLGQTITRVPAYAPESVAEHTLALLLTLNRKTHKAYNRVKENNFSLQGLLGFNLSGKTVGIIGTGKIGQAVVRIFAGFGCKLLCHDPIQSEIVLQSGARYEPLQSLLSACDIISLHCPLTPETQHLINDSAIEKMKPGAILINTSRGGLVDTKAVIGALKSKKLGGLALDVYEMESELFFNDLSGEIIQDDVFQRLLTFPNVVITGHQGFFTEEALTEIATTTINNLLDFNSGTIKPENQIAIAPD